MLRPQTVGDDITDLSSLAQKQKELFLTVSYRAVNQ